MVVGYPLIHLAVLAAAADESSHRGSKVRDFDDKVLSPKPGEVPYDDSESLPMLYELGEAGDGSYVGAQFRSPTLEIVRVAADECTVAKLDLTPSTERIASYMRHIEAVDAAVLKLADAALTFTKQGPEYRKALKLLNEEIEDATPDDVQTIREIAVETTSPMNEAVGGLARTAGEVQRSIESFTNKLSADDSGSPSVSIGDVKLWLELAFRSATPDQREKWFQRVIDLIERTDESSQTEAVWAVCKSEDGEHCDECRTRRRESMNEGRLLMMEMIGLRANVILLENKHLTDVTTLMNATCKGVAAVFLEGSHSAIGRTTGWLKRAEWFSNSAYPLVALPVVGCYCTRVKEFDQGISSEIWGLPESSSVQTPEQREVTDSILEQLRTWIQQGSDASSRVRHFKDVKALLSRLESFGFYERKFSGSGSKDHKAAIVHKSNESDPLYWMPRKRKRDSASWVARVQRELRNAIVMRSKDKDPERAEPAKKILCALDAALTE